MVGLKEWWLSQCEKVMVGSDSNIMPKENWIWYPEEDQEDKFDHIDAVTLIEAHFETSPR